MQLTTVKSSNVAAYGVVGDDLIIKYNTGALYRYFNAGDHAAAMARTVRSGESIGSYVDKFVKKKGIPFARLEKIPS